MGSPKREVRSAKQAVRRVIEVELLDREEQADHVANMMAVRADVRHVQACATMLNGLTMCGNEFLRPDLIDKEFAKLEQIVAQARARMEAARLCA